MGVCERVACSYKAQVKGLAPPPVGIPRYSRLNAVSPSARRSRSRNSGSQLGFTSAVARSRIHVGSSLDHAVQNGSARLHAVESMARRACGRRARIGRNAAMRSLERRAASSATIQASTVSSRTESSLPGSANTRAPLSALVRKHGHWSAWRRTLTAPRARVGRLRHFDVGPGTRPLTVTPA